MGYAVARRSRLIEHDRGSSLTIHPTAAETELAEIMGVLRECLARLDRARAGIAAIHVNAAIEHLAALGGAEIAPVGENAQALERIGAGGDDPLAAIDPRLICILPATGRPH